MKELSWGTLGWLTGMPATSMLAGMIIVQWVQPTPKLTALFQHFAAGVVLSAISIEVLPELLLPSHESWMDGVGMTVGFTVGVTLMLLIARFEISMLTGLLHLSKKPDRRVSAAGVRADVAAVPSPQPGRSVTAEKDLDPEAQMLGEDNENMLLVAGPAKQRHKRHSCPACIDSLAAIPWGFIVPVATDACMDGLLIGIAFVAGEVEGSFIVALALTIEMCFLGITASAMLRKCAVVLGVAVPICVLIPGLIVASGFAGASVLANLSGPAYIGVLSFGLAALLFLVSDELLVEAHKEEETDTWWITSMFFIGYALVVVIERVSIASTSSASE